MPDCSDLSDHAWLTGEEAAGLIAELAGREAPLLAAVERLRKRVSPERAHRLMELIELRRRAAAKFDAAQRMFFSRTSLEQATDECVAHYKAARFSSAARSGSGRSTAPPRAADHCSPTTDGAGVSGTVADLCCGIGGDMLALARHLPVVAVDCDPVASLYASSVANSRVSRSGVLPGSG